MTSCPGKSSESSFGRHWQRDLQRDLDSISSWGARAVVTLIELHEFHQLNVHGLRQGVLDRGMDWLHLPVVDRASPDLRFENAWMTAGPRLHRLLRDGCRFVVHSRGGLGRTGTVVARLLVERGETPVVAIRLVRSARAGAIETQQQERYIQRQKSLPPMCLCA